MYDKSHPSRMLNKKDRYSQTQIHIAGKDGNLEMLRFLLEQGANPHIRSGAEGEEETVLQITARWSHLGLVEYLLEKVDWSK